MKAGAGAETALYKDLNCRFCGSFFVYAGIDV